MKFSNFEVLDRKRSSLYRGYCLIAKVEYETESFFVKKKKGVEVVVGLQTIDEEGIVLSTKWFWADTKENVSPWRSADLTYMAHEWYERKQEEKKLEEFDDFITTTRLRATYPGELT